MDNEGIDGPSYIHVVEAIKVNIGQSGLRKLWDMYDLGPICCREVGKSIRNKSYLSIGLNLQI